MLIKRNRLIYFILIVFVIFLGLLSRTAYLQTFLGTYAGDALWALMVYIIIGFLFTRLKPKYVALFALAFSYTIEISQLYHAPWIDYIRNTTSGGLVFGFGFLWSDLVCYTVGIFIGLLIETICHKKL